MLIDHMAVIPFPEISRYLINTVIGISAFLAFVYAGIAIHEIGHALGGITAGFSISSVTIGSGRQLLRIRLRDFRLIIRAGPGGGRTALGSASAESFKWRYLLFVSGGILAQGLAVTITIWLFHISISGILRFENLSLAHLFIGTNLLMIAANLVPAKYKVLGFPVRSDGLRILRLPFLKPDEIRNIMGLCKANEALVMYEEKKYAAAEAKIKEACAISPESLETQFNLAIIYLKLGKISESIKLLESLLEISVKNEYTFLVYNNLAWAYLLIGDAEALQQADKYSLQAMEHNSSLDKLSGTRGCVLIELGAVDQGIALLKKQTDLHKPIDDDTNDAISITYLAYGYYLKGETEKSGKYLQKVRSEASSMDNDYKILFERISRKMLPTL